MPSIKKVIDMMIADGKSDADIRAVISRYNESIAAKTETSIDTDVIEEESTEEDNIGWSVTADTSDDPDPKEKPTIIFY